MTIHLWVYKPASVGFIPWTFLSWKKNSSLNQESRNPGVMVKASKPLIITVPVPEVLTWEVDLIHLILNYCCCAGLAIWQKRFCRSFHRRMKRRSLYPALYGSVSIFVTSTIPLLYSSKQCFFSLKI